MLLLIKGEKCMTVELFSQITNIAFIVLFIVAIVTILIAGLVGFKNGVWRTTFRMCIFGILFTVAICTLGSTSNLLGNLPIDFFPQKTLILSRTVGSETIKYNVPLTTLFGTLESGFRGYYLLYGLAGNSARATELAIAISTSVMKWATFAVDVLLILIFGWLLDIILWHAAFKRLIPKLVRRMVKWPWFAMIQNAVTYVVSAFMLLAPVTSIINAINGPLKNADKGENTNQIVLYMDSFIKNYNNSLFAKTFINWTADANGLTLDAQVMNAITSSTFENVEISIIDTIHSVSEIGSALVSAIAFDPSFSVNLPTALSTEVVTSIFDSLDSSGLILSVLPVAAELVMNEDMVGKVLKGIDPRLLDMSDVDWRSELRNAETMILDLINSDVVGNLISDDGKSIKKIELSEFIPQCMTSTTFSKVEHALSTIDDSKLMKRLIPSIVSWLGSTNETAGKYLPNSWDELNDIQWGFELSALLECVHEIYLTNPEVLDLVLSSFSSSTPEPTPSSLRRDGEPGGEDPEPQPDVKNELIKLLIKDIGSYENIIIGEFDSNNQPLNVDSYGRSIVYKDGKKIPGRSYCLMDLQLAKSMITPLLNTFTNKSSDPAPTPTPSSLHTPEPNRISADELKEKVNEVIAELNKGAWRQNFKQELSTIFYTFESFKDNPDAISGLISGESIVPSSGKLTDIDPSISSCLAKALPRMDNSKLLSAVIYPLLEETLVSTSTTDLLSSLNIDTDLVSAGVDIAKANNEFGYEMAKIIRSISAIGTMSDCLDAGSSNAILSQIGENSESVAFVLDTFHSCKIINPTRDVAMEINSNPVRLNENFYNILDYVFGTALTVPGFSFKESEILPTTVWENAKDSNGDFFRDRYGDPIYSGESGAIAEVLKLIGSSGICASLDDPDFFKSNDNLVKLAKTQAQGGYDLPGILAAVERSNVFSATMGDFLDETLKDMHIVGTADVTFNNVTNWEEEGQNLATVLLCLEGVELNLNSLNLSSCDDIVSLNRLLHALTESTIFTRKTDGEFLFSKWIFSKFTDNTNGLTNLFAGYDLVKDPDHSNWDPKWSNYLNYQTPVEGFEDYSILYNDLCSLNTRDQWSSPEFDFDSPKTHASSYGPIDEYDLTGFYGQYKEIFNLDELGHLSELIYWTRKATAVPSPIDMDSSVFAGIINTLNETTCLRIGVYNLYEIAKRAINEKPNVQKYFDLSPEYDTYVINCDYPSMSLFQEAREKRAVEIGYLKNLYEAYKYMAAGVLDMETGDFNADKVDATFIALLKEAVKGVNESLVFHRKGSAVYDPAVPDAYYPTVFQNMLSAIYLKTDLNTIIYCADNPKDVYYSTVEPLYEPNVESKVQYMMEEHFNWRFPTGTLPEIEFNWQINEVDRVFDFLNAICGGSKLDGTGNYKGLKKKNSHNEYEITFSFKNFDIALPDNVTAVEEILVALNKTETLYDSVPNSVFSALTESGIADQFSSLDKINFSDANLFYHYFDNVNPTDPHPYNWTAKFTDSSSLGISGQSDVDFICSLMREASLYASTIPSVKAQSVITSFENIQDAKVDVLNNFLNNTLHSKVFHSAGPRRTVDTSGAVIGVTGCTKTVFQEVIEQFLSTPDIADNIINTSDNPKDAEATTAGKIESIALNVFPYDSTNYTYQERQIDYLCDFIDCAKSFSTSQLDNFDMGDDSLNADALFDILSVMNQSDCLYDCVPNIIHQALTSSSFDQFGGEVSLSDADAYYHYTVGTTDYTRHYSQSELDALHGIITAYQDLNATTHGYNLEDVFIIKALCDNGSLRGVLENMHNSGMFHLHHYKNSVDGQLTVYESTIYYFVKTAGLDVYTYGETDARARMIANIEAVTEREQTLPDPSTASFYHNQWVAPSGYDELSAFIDFVRDGADFLGEGTLSFDDFSFGGGKDYDPHEISNLMYRINKTDFISDALPVFVKNGFEDISLDALTSLGTERYSFYNLSQKDYGQATNRGDISVSEIDLIEDALENMYLRSGTTGSYITLSNVTDFVTKVDTFEGIMKFAQYGKILNTKDNGDGTYSYNVMNENGSYHVSARGVLFYNIFKNATSTGEGVTAYIRGDDATAKAATLSKIFTFQDIENANYSYRYESIGVMQLATDAPSLNPETMVTSNFENFSTIEAPMGRLLKECYDVDGFNHKSYFTMEIMSNVLNEIADSEAAHASVSAPIYYGTASTGDDCAFIIPSMYDSMTRSELEGVTASIRFYKTFKNYISTHVADRATFITEMNELDGSEFAKLIWASRVDPALSALSIAPLNPLDAGSDFKFYAHSSALATSLGL